MIVFVEISGPFQIRPGLFIGKIQGGRTWRLWWLWFSVGTIPVDLHKFVHGLKSGEIVWSDHN